MLFRMLAAPIARREMLVLAKSPGFYRTRVTASILLLVLGSGYALLYHYFGFMAAAQLVSTVSFILLMFCLFLGVHLTADSIAREKREGTLGLLFLTPLTAFQIVTGKLLAHALIGFYSVFLAFPLLSFVLIAGGVLFTEMFFLGVIALNTIFVSAAAGLLGSTVRADRKKAANTGTHIILFLWWGLPALARVTSYYNGPDWLQRGLLFFSVGPTNYWGMLTPGMTAKFGSLYVFACNHAVGWILLALAAFFLRRNWQEAPPRPKFSFREWWKKLSYGSARVRARLRQELLEQNPFLWLASRDRLRSVGLWVVTTIIFGILAWVYARNPGQIQILVGFTIVLSFIQKAITCGTGGAQLLVEQEQGTMEMLTSTPLSTREIVQGQFKAAVRQIRGPVLLVLLLHLVTISLILLIPWGAARYRPLGALAFLGYSLMYVFDLYTACWLAMWGAVITREAKHAAGAALLRLVIMPALVFAGGMSVLALVQWMFQINYKPPPAVLLITWLGLGVANNLFWLYRVRKALPEEIRKFSLRRYASEEPRGFFVTLGRVAGSVVRRRRLAR